MKAGTGGGHTGSRPLGLGHWGLTGHQAFMSTVPPSESGRPGGPQVASVLRARRARSRRREWQCLHGGPPGDQTRKSPACRPRDPDSRSGNRDSRSRRPNRETGDFKFPIPDSSMIGSSLPAVSRPNRERELGTSGSGRHKENRPVLGSFKLRTRGEAGICV